MTEGMITDVLAELSDRELLDATAQAASRERRSTTDLIVLLAEVDARRLYLGEGYSSLFMYCTQALHFSEPAAYRRIAAAREARRYPVVVARLAGGDITLTTISLLAPHLTAENHISLLDAARHKSKRSVEIMIAALSPRPDVPEILRRISGPPPDEPPAPDLRVGTPVTSPELEGGAAATEQMLRTQEHMVRPHTMPRSPARSLVEPLAPERYLLRMTIDGETYRKLERARALLRHAIPDGDRAAIVDRALTLLIEQLERKKTGAVSRPKPRRTVAGGWSRSLPAAVRRAVWARDEGRCAYVGVSGRCIETSFLEFHHVKPFADGGESTVENLQLRCRAHNQHEARLYFAM